ncbi:MAG: hypothetical protein IKB89_01870 [Clostridia bacterium]|nr:hypothetical protein [Clostridia bacterium]
MNIKNKKVMIALSAVLAVIILVAAFFIISGAVKKSKHDKMLENMQSLSYINKLAYSGIKMDELKYLADFENWEFDGDRDTLTYRFEDGDIMDFVFKENGEIWYIRSTNMDIFINEMLPEYKGVEMSRYELNLLLRREFDLDVDAGRVYDTVPYNNFFIQLPVAEHGLNTGIFGDEFVVGHKYY